MLGAAADRNVRAPVWWQCQDALVLGYCLRPSHAWELLLQSGFQLGVGIRSESGPIAGRFQPFAVGCAEPKPYWEPAFADLWMVFQGKTFVQFDLQLRWRGLAIFIARRFRVLQLELSAIEPGNAR